ncbi:histidine kinase [Chitinophaga silvatica]|uniref:Histidine kinase n=1 Tax=Chitinophaga silvatica TaxID=2282649 RepID=A0A3E1YAT6_9BACT|nr:histidine kinase [Chitinophaga silvatica]
MFWVIVTIVLTIFYGMGLPDYGTALLVILMILPVHILYFYTVAYWILPKYLYRKKYLQLCISLFACVFLAGLFFRLIEILVADPYILGIIRKKDPQYQWHKLDGNFWQQLKKPVYIINALEQSNLVVWIGISLKFVQMWYEKRQLAVQSELSALKSQIHPHFLFNTLNNLYALTLKQSEQSPAIVLGLSDILRYMLYECSTDNVELRRDVEIMKHYIELEKLRYEERLDLSFSITGNLENQRIPPLLMLPLIENAFKHGTSATVDDAWVNINLSLKGSRLKFKVSNSKPLATENNSKNPSEQIGLTNVRKRLELLFPFAHQLQVFDEDEVFVVIMQVDLKQNLIQNENQDADS